MCSLKNLIILAFGLIFSFGCDSGGGSTTPQTDTNVSICQIGKCDSPTCPHCPNNVGQDGKDGSVNTDQSGDQSNVDGSANDSVQKETETYQCPPTPPEECIPKEAKSAYCHETAHLCAGGGFYQGQPCTTDAECQQVPADKMPPCVCWDICWLVGTKWGCTDGTSFDFSDMTLHGGGTDCQIDGIIYTDKSLFYQPGGNLLRYPAEGELKFQIEFATDHKQIHMKVFDSEMDKTCNLM